MPIEYMKSGEEVKTPLHLTSGSVGSDQFNSSWRNKTSLY